ncbi:thiolase family protein [Amycolatopsis thermoflava]|uniref:thiolase family protein n=1 Tax=Amycolatopsis thermoflava TaxID=84480 RepID=UPI003D73812F
MHVVDLVRTPFGRFGGGLADVRPDDLAATVVRALVDRHPHITDHIDDVVLGNVNGAGEDNRNVARMAVLLAGLPQHTPGVTVNRLCGSGLEAVIAGYRAIALGEADVVIAGGVESMTRAPWVLPKPDRAFPHRDLTAYSSTIGWRMSNPRMDRDHTVAMGEGAEILADQYGIDRVTQDRFALESHRKAATAQAAGSFDGELVEGEWELDRDECIRPGTDLIALSRLKPAFRATGTVTAGNSSPINDGASAVLLAGESAAERYGLESRARIVSVGVTALQPRLFGLGPVEATRRALARAGRELHEVEVMELNEAFAAQALACLAELAELDAERINPRGGAIAIGHPLGATGGRLVGSVATELSRRGSGLGVATACIGIGQGLAVVLER